ncbi:N-acetylmuramoyl-L-alanine amidase [Pedobacter nyackensis]|uniref:N-acetylmuramoyl-L-alanine amidase n=1 Tax=Pedobacter nyackensis TaxID=475255 RepID=A0A1W1ZYL5_9SPHI|nr:N-acetylmuramoyl-L-alanine amidase [Pedobacter nyackensis]SMC53446.1 N-acetylmuramoyl-L-alanine amidase [Pedobacter nyackensis]
MRRIDYIVLHCTAGPQNQTIDTIKRYWKNELGWSKPGYHYLINADGSYEKIHPIESPTNGVAGNNAHSIHISYIGGVEVLQSINKSGKVINVVGKSVDNRTEAQIATQIAIIKKLKPYAPNAKIVGHRDFSPDKNHDGILQPNEWMKACPSFDVKSWIKSVGL